MSESMSVLKWDVPIDDQAHIIGSGKVLHAACQNDVHTVQIWTLENDTTRSQRVAQVFGTGQPLPDSVVSHIGSTIAGPFVWHVFEVA